MKVGVAGRTQMGTPEPCPRSSDVWRTTTEVCFMLFVRLVGAGRLGRLQGMWGTTTTARATP
jgi:hypothetical protein